MFTNISATRSNNAPDVLFLFAHQDDEFGVFHQIEKEIRSGSRVFCAYSTTGVQIGEDPLKRKNESISVLMELGVSRDRILFVGEKLGIADRRTLQHLNALHTWLNAWIAKSPNLTSVYIPAWEGGHPDHDGLHATCLYAIQIYNPMIQTWQYPLYNAQGLKSGLFRVLTPLIQNGSEHREIIALYNRFRYLRLCRLYKSQWKSWIGLYPMLIWHYIFKGWQSLQPTSMARLLERPHIGSLYYEQRGFSNWIIMSTYLSETFSKQH